MRLKTKENITRFGVVCLLRKKSFSTRLGFDPNLHNNHVHHIPHLIIKVVFIDIKLGVNTSGWETSSAIFSLQDTFNA